jgi:hypothetical protein
MPSCVRSGETVYVEQPAVGDYVLQVRITLDDVERPQVWRRVQVPATIRLGQLHRVIQVVMGWENGHLHSFAARGTTYGEPEPELNFRDQNAVSLGELVAEGESLSYTYDFGDCWTHTITVERRLSAEADRPYPVCTGGNGACPPEDCGGTYGYANLKDILDNPDDDEHAEMLEWLRLDSADAFNASHFDLGHTNARLTKASKR